MYSTSSQSKGAKHVMWPYANEANDVTCMHKWMCIPSAHAVVQKEAVVTRLMPGRPPDTWQAVWQKQAKRNTRLDTVQQDYYDVSHLYTCSATLSHDFYALAPCIQAELLKGACCSHIMPPSKHIFYAVWLWSLGAITGWPPSCTQDQANLDDTCTLWDDLVMIW